MKRDFAISVGLHLAVVAATLLAAPFTIQSERSYDEVIRVSLTAAPMIANAAPEPEPAPLQPVETPAASMEEELPDIPLDDPTTKDEVEEVEEPEPEPEQPKPKPETRPAEQQPQGKPDAQQSEGEGSEIDTEATAAGSPFAGATVDNASFDYPYWFRLAFGKIQNNWRNTVAIDATLVCEIRFQVISSGRVIDVKVVESSGIERFDQDCVAAIERAAPFPPLPRDFREEIIGITIPFKFEPR